MSDLAVLIYVSSSQDDAKFFNKNWEKFKNSYNYVIPYFYINESKNKKVIKYKARRIYRQLLDFLRKG